MKRTASGGPFPVKDVTRETGYPGGGVSGGPEKLNNHPLNGEMKQSNMGYYEFVEPVVGVPPKHGVEDTSKGPDAYGTPKAMNTDQPFNTMDPDKDVKGGM